jgi:hypothetical protein
LIDKETYLYIILSRKREAEKAKERKIDGDREEWRIEREEERNP